MLKTFESQTKLAVRCTVENRVDKINLLISHVGRMGKLKKLQSIDHFYLKKSCWVVFIWPLTVFHRVLRRKVKTINLHLRVSLDKRVAVICFNRNQKMWALYKYEEEIDCFIDAKAIFQTFNLTFWFNALVVFPNSCLSLSPDLFRSSETLLLIELGTLFWRAPDRLTGKWSSSVVVRTANIYIWEIFSV